MDPGHQNELKKFSAIFCLFGATAILLGAFGAHGLKNLVTPERFAIFETGVRYQMFQSLFGLFISLHYQASPTSTALIKTALLLSIAGMLIFSGSLYLLVIFDKSSLGAITPIGGILLVFSWLIVFLFCIRKPKLNRTQK
jgi:uncharacterized membrane protein YgdD (TMEM256/DUF423 family)